MNEKIKQLAKLASFNEKDMESMSPKLKNFYELMVNESVECIRDVLRNESSDLNYKATNEVQNHLRNFFGVEGNV